MALTPDELRKAMNDALSEFIDNDICLVCGSVSCEEHKNDDIFIGQFFLAGDF